MATVQTEPGRVAAPARRVSRWPYAVAGLVAALAGMAVGHVLAVVAFGSSSSPVLAVGSQVVDATPVAVEQWAVHTLGTSDKPFLLTMVALVTGLAAAGIGVVGRTRPTLARLLLAGLALVAAVCASLRPEAGNLPAVPSIAAGLVGLPVFSRLRGRAVDGETRGMAYDPRMSAYEPGTRPAPDRRGFLAAAGGVVAGGVALVVGSRLVGPGKPRGPLPALPAPVDAAPALPTGLDARVKGITPFRTPAKDFYRVDTEFLVPHVDAAGWKLTIDGDVAHPFSITYAELLRMPMIERDITLACVSNEVNGDLTGGARWLGVRTKDLLERAGVHSTADQILSTSTSGMTISTPLAALLDGRDALVAVAMNGARLPDAHGFPARLVTPGLYGFTGATKWVSRMTATTYAAQSAYWTEQGWVTDAPVKTEARIDTPTGRVSAGRTAIAGVAWAMHRGIRSVEVRVDDGDWQAATMGPDAGIDYWRQWYLPWEATPGRHTLVARATDDTGAVQTAAHADPYPAGASGYPSVTVTVS
ncbi:putative membrane-bound oxidoreductase [Nostocoides japonicum T1-X7]|uniref:Putative membrane-bound oxidoreductase n=1 Tax=Nostocoides japonicum T1-X7 TaxID=1194083 RepID=A0A077LSK0_9MICO|nr:molybdopterin-dependent oxidoreductase [Tetrasphaera japonica]CCH75873.1 putative membrane-bound oxidoreductase [Tetrasphaera japonica T1-X7]